MKKFAKNIRLKSYDYSREGMYFITVCTKDKYPYFGKIQNEQMILNYNGRILKNEILKTASLRKNIVLDQWIIMPNHFHLIIAIYQQIKSPQRGDATSNWKPNSISSIINQLKSAAIKKIRLQKCLPFSWQRNYYDHIIRSERALNRIRNYIFYNPINWQYDKENLNSKHDPKELAFWNWIQDQGDKNVQY